VLSQSAARELVRDQLFPAWRRERERLDGIDRWYRWQQDEIKLPRKATPELRALADLSKTPWLGLVVTAAAQCMYVDGYRSPLDTDGPVEGWEGPWRTWHANDFDQRQVQVHRGALAYGYSFVTVLPGRNGQGPTSVMRGVSARKMHAVYGEPAEDDWPMFAIQVAVNDDKSHLVRLYDEEAVYFLSVDSTGDKVEFIEWRRHGAGVPPVVRYTNMLDLDGRTPGEVEPFIPAAARINKTAFDRMLTQHYASWKVRYATGMAEPDDEEESNRKKLQLRQDDILIAEDTDTTFGTLDATPLDGFISAWRSDIEALAAVSQTPTHALTGQLVNLSAEALAAARASLTQKVYERQRSFGKSHAQALRLAAALEGDQAHAADVMGRVTWQDMEIRSMSQAVDALGKAATMLHVPVQALWARIPGVEKSDVDEWTEMAKRADPLARFEAELERQAAEA
jgi:hypothetical protein